MGQPLQTRRSIPFALTLWAAGSATGCLDPAPGYEDPLQLPPFIVSDEVEPPLTTVFRMGPTDSEMRITVPFRSEDLGERVFMGVLLDVQPGQRGIGLVRNINVAPSTFDVIRSPEIVVSREDFRDSSTNCHNVMVLLTHDSNRLAQGTVLDERRAARAVWWLDLVDAEDDTLLRDCPTTGDPL